MNRSKAAIACSLVAAVPLIAAAPGASQQGQGRVTISADPVRVVFGSSTLISGEARGGGGENAAVRIEQDPFPFDGVFIDAATGTTDAQGAYRARLAPPVSTVYRATVNGRQSSTLLVPVRIRVTNRVSDSTPRRGQLVRFYGSALPAHDGASVRVERRAADGSYGVVARTRLRDAGDERSSYSRRIRARRTGTYRVVVLSPHGDHVEGVSRSRRLRVGG